MPFFVKFDTPMQNSPLAAMIPDATPFNDGVMTKEQAAALAALVAGGGFAPGPFVTWTSLGFFDGFHSGVAPFGVAESRVVGDTVELSGLVIGPPGGTAGNFHCTTLPPDQHPSAVRLMTGSYQVGAAAPVTVWIAVDNGTLTGTAGAVVIGGVGHELPAGGVLITLDGLSFVL